jgi:hypothetical protein
MLSDEPRTDPSVTPTLAQRPHGESPRDREIDGEAGLSPSSVTAGLAVALRVAPSARQAPFVTPMVASLAAPSPCMAWTRFPRLSTPTSRPS